MTRRKSEAASKRDLENLEAQIITTLNTAMTTADKNTEKVAAANAAIKFLAVKSRIPGEYGAGLDD